MFPLFLILCVGGPLSILAEAENTTTLYVGALYPLFSSLRYLDTPQGALIGLEEINEDPSLLPGYRLEMVKDVTAINSRCKQAIAMAKLLNQTVDSSPYHPMVGVLGAGCSSASEGGAAVSRMLGLPQVSHSSTSPRLSDSEFDYFSRVIVSDAYGGVALAKLLKSMGHKRLGIVFNTGTYARTFFEEFMDELSSDGYMKVRMGENQSCTALTTNAVLSVPRFAHEGWRLYGFTVSLYQG